MNERIRELVNLHFLVMPDEEEVEAFANHLVKYCAVICNTVSGDQVDNASKDYQEGRAMGATVCKNQILKYFGVEE